MTLRPLSMFWRSLNTYEKADGPQLADRFTSELEKFIRYVAERPESFLEIRSGIRRANLDRFRITCFFRSLTLKP